MEVILSTWKLKSVIAFLNPSTFFDALFHKNVLFSIKTLFLIILSYVWMLVWVQLLKALETLIYTLDYISEEDSFLLISAETLSLRESSFVCIIEMWGKIYSKIELSIFHEDSVINSDDSVFEKIASYVKNSLIFISGLFSKSVCSSLWHLSQINCMYFFPHS